MRGDSLEVEGPWSDRAVEGECISGAEGRGAVSVQIISNQADGFPLCTADPPDMCRRNRVDGGERSNRRGERGDVVGGCGIGQIASSQRRVGAGIQEEV